MNKLLLGNVIKVSNIIGHSNRKIPNQFEIQTDKGTVFRSYNSIICAVINSIDDNCSVKQVYLDYKFWNYSRTTSKYRSIFMNENTKETEKKIKSGEYILTNLN